MITDITAILINLSESLGSVQSLLKGFGYIIGILFVCHGLFKMKNATESSNSQEGKMASLIYIVIGASLIYLPSAMAVYTSTLFGAGNVLQYTPYTQYSVYDAMKVLIKTSGIIWFIRGSVLIAHASEPGGKEGAKGLTFLTAGIMSINLDSTIAVLNYFMGHLIAISSTAKNAMGL